MEPIRKAASDRKVSIQTFLQNETVYCTPEVTDSTSAIQINTSADVIEI